jgi:hypothetical protein
MEDEYGALMSNGTWDLVPRPQGSNVVTGKWVFTHKFHVDGTFDCYKARWVLRGFTQRPGVDYVLGTELSLSSRGRMTLGVEAIFWFISHTLSQCHALQRVGDTYL